MVILVVVGIALALFGVWPLVAPLHCWRTLQAWKYKNPEAHEPSAAALAFERFGGGLGILAGIVTAVLGGQAVANASAAAARCADEIAPAFEAAWDAADIENPNGDAVDDYLGMDDEDAVSDSSFMSSFAADHGLAVSSAGSTGVDTGRYTFTDDGATVMTVDVWYMQTGVSATPDCGSRAVPSNEHTE
ncbi:DUF6199 family natural product biosynthesis protein [Brevibacterium litoralis]|uniref:DUF6199 family natural product biosynthesis protein n=1 Tax=Brevibacterium litoralis TaxID=3138935 RepID=UPI0032EC722F